MIRLFKSALARAFTYLLVTVLAGGLLLGALRLAVPYADAFRGQVEALVGEHIGLAVHLGAMEVRLRGWSPQLRFRDARILDPASGQTQLAMHRLALDLDLPASLRALSPKIGAVTLIGARLLVRRLADGRLLVAGIDRAGGADRADLASFLHRGGFRLEKGELTWMDEGSAAPPLVLSGVSASLVNAGDRQRLVVRASGLAGSSADLHLVADLTGDAAASGHWGGPVYLGFSGADLAPLVRTPLPVGLQLGSGGVRLEVWARLEDGEVDEARARFDMADLDLTRAPPGLPQERLHLQALGAILDWQRLAGGQGWRLDVRDLTLMHQGRVWPATELGLVWSGRQEGAPWELRGGLRLARLGEVMALVDAAAPTLSRLIPIDGLNGFDRLLEARPDAAVHDLAWRLTGGSGGAGGAPTWAVRARVEGLASAAAGPIPGVRGLDLDLAADQGGGRLTLSGAGVTLDLPRLLREPLHLERLAGDLNWHLESDGRVRIDVPELVADHAAVATRTALMLCLPAGGGSPFLDLRGYFGEGDVTKARGLIPTGILKPDLVAWLDRAVIAGRVPSGAVLFRGRLEDFPFREHEGRLEVLFDARDGVLDYLTGWPKLTGVDGQLLFLNERMEIVLERARILDSAVTGGTAQVDDLFNTKTLEVSATVEGPLTDGLRVLREGPLAHDLGRLAEAFDAGGGMLLGLDLSVPLQHGLPLGIEGKVTWPAGARIALKGTQVELRDPSGALTFGPHSLSAEGIEARLWGEPVHLAITNLGTDPVERRTRVWVRSTTPVQTLAKRLPSPLWSQLQGTASWSLAVNLRNADVGREAVPMGFELESDLRRVAVRLPAPLGKPAGAARALRIAGQFTPGASLTLDATYDPQGRGSPARGREPQGDDPQGRGSPARGREPQGDDPQGRGSPARGTKPQGDGGLAAHLDFSPQPGGALALAGGRIDLGAADAGANPPPGGEGLWLTASLPSLDGDAWQDWWSREGTGLSAQPGPVSGRVGLLRGAELRIGHLTLGGAGWDDLRLGLTRDAGPWVADLKATQVSGTLRLPERPRVQPITGRLTRLDLKALAGDDGPERPTQAEAPELPEVGRTDPREVPALDLEVEHAHWGQADLGRLRLVTRARQDGLDVAELSLQGSLGSATGSGAWTQRADGLGAVGVPITRLAVEGKTADLGELLRRLEFSSVLEHAPAQATLSADWPGGPGDFALSRLGGRVGFEVGAGGLLEVEPGMGRMLGILNIGALQRRLTLDFSDLFAKGYRFEGMTGDITLTRGEARIDRFEIRGPAADIAITGRTDLKDRRFDQLATVTPKISTGVAVASGVVGGPLVGAAVYLVDRAIGGAIDSLGRYQYRIEGPWDAPQVSPVRGPAATGVTTEASPIPGPSPDPSAGPQGGSKPPTPAPRPAAREGQNPFLR